MPTEWIRSAAEALAQALAGGRVPRPARRVARRCLALAFDAIEQGRGDSALLRRLERIAAPALRPPPEPPIVAAIEARLRPPRGWVHPVGVRIEWAARGALVDRLTAHQRLHDGIARRIDAVFATFRTRPDDAALQVRTHRLARQSEMDTHTLTRG